MNQKILEIATLHLNEEQYKKIKSYLNHHVNMLAYVIQTIDDLENQPYEDYDSEMIEALSQIEALLLGEFKEDVR